MIFASFTDGFRSVVMGISLLGCSLTAFADAGNQTDWEKGWESEPVRERLRWERLQEYRKIVTDGGFEVQGRLYQVPEANSEEVLKKILTASKDSKETSDESLAQKRGSRVIPLDRDEVAALDRAFPRELTWPPFIVPMKEERRNHLDRTIAVRAISDGFGRELVVAGGDFKVHPIVSSPRPPQGPRRSATEGPISSEPTTLKLAVSFSEIIGFSEKPDGFVGHSAVPWKERLMERLLEFDYPEAGAYPVFRPREVSVELEISPEMPEYLLMRASPDKATQSASDVLRQQTRRVRSFEPLADYPANSLEYWVVFKISQLPGKKPASL